MSDLLVAYLEERLKACDALMRNTAYATALKVDQARRDLSAARRSEAQYVAAARQARAIMNEAEAAYNEAWENFVPAALALSRKAGCIC